MHHTYTVLCHLLIGCLHYHTRIVMSRFLSYTLLVYCACHIDTAPLCHYTAAWYGCLLCHRKAPLLHLDILPLQDAAFYHNCILLYHTFGIFPVCHHCRYRCIDCLQSYLSPAKSLVLLGSCLHHRHILCTDCRFSGILWYCRHCTRTLLSFCRYPTLHRYCSLNHNDTLSLFLSHLSDG